MLQECYEENETLSQTLLVKELESFGHLTALDLAVMAEDQNFIAHVSCQVLLTRLWMGTMAMNTQWWKVCERCLTGVGWESECQMKAIYLNERYRAVLFRCAVNFP